MRFLEKERGWILPSLLYVDESEEDLWAMVGRFVEVFKRSGL